MKGPIFVCLTVLGFLYTFHINLFGIYTFLNRYSDLQPILFLIWLFSGVLCLFSLASWLKQTVRNLKRGIRGAMNRMVLWLHQITALVKSIALIGPSATWHLWRVTREARKSGANIWLSDMRGEQ